MTVRRAGVFIPLDLEGGIITGMNHRKGNDEHEESIHCSFRARDKPGKQQSAQNAVSAATTFSFGGSSAGKSVTPRNAIQVSVVYACVRVIAETIASLPFGVFQEKQIDSFGQW